MANNSDVAFSCLFSIFQHAKTHELFSHTYAQTIQQFTHTLLWIVNKWIPKYKLRYTHFLALNCHAGSAPFLFSFFEVRNTEQNF